MPKSFNKTDFPFEIRIIRANRKSIGIYIDDNAKVIARAPFFVTNGQIFDVVKKHEEWIINRIEEKKKQKSSLIDYGKALTLFDGEYVVKGHDVKEYSIGNGAINLPNGLNQEQIIKIVRLLLLKKAYDVINPKVTKFSKIMGVKPFAVKVNNAKKRLGSCNTKNAINFSLRLLFLKEDLIDYVVVHELAHIKHHNHSAAFWQEVSRYIPDYKLKNKDSKNDIIDTAGI